jgi:hypothetical protein
MIGFYSGRLDRAVYGIHEMGADIRLDIVWEDDEKVVVAVLPRKACSSRTNQDYPSICAQLLSTPLNAHEQILVGRAERPPPDAG